MTSFRQFGERFPSFDLHQRADLFRRRGMIARKAPIAARPRRARNASASTTSPASTAASAWRMSRIAFGSERRSSVSSSDSSSSGLTRTAAGRPWRVSTTRSCRSSTPSTISESRFLISARGSTSSDMTRILVRCVGHGTAAKGPSRDTAWVVCEATRCRTYVGRTAAGQVRRPRRRGRAAAPDGPQ